MAEYIERKTAKDELLSWAVCINHPEHLMREDAMHVLDSIPAADVAPVRHGRWENGYIDTGDGPMPERAYLCSQCGKAQWRKSRYCPNCGCKMLEASDGKK